MKRLVLVLILAAAPALRAQDSSAYYRKVAPPPKDGTVAFALSFVLPGLGQVYAGEPALGGILFAGAAGGTALALDNAQLVERCARSSPSATLVCSSDRRDGNLVTAGLFVAAASWIVSMAEAPSAARQFNEKHRIALRIEPGAAGSTRVLVSFAP